MKKILAGLVGFILILGLAGACSAAEELAMPKLSFGGDIRIRGQVTANNHDLSSRSGEYDNEQYYRERTRLWVKGEFEEGFTAYIRLTAEPRWGHADTVYNDSSNNAEWYNHVIIDNSYIEGKNLWGSPISLKIGRQDMGYGEGFLIYDGTNDSYIGDITNIGDFDDGSRTTYFDAIKLTGVFGDTSADLFTAKVNEGVFNTQDDEDLYGLYITNKSLKDRTIEVYGLERDRRFNPDNPTIADWSKDRTIAVGARSTGKVIENLTYAVELAHEFGKAYMGLEAEDEQDRNAWGGLASLTYAMAQVPTQPSIKLAAYYTSGDKNGTEDKNEGWDCFYSEFPKYGYGDMLANISKNAEYRTGDEGIWSNDMIYEVDLKANPLPKMTTSLGYLYLMANTTPNADASKVRGRCPQAKLEYQFTKAVSANLVGQYFLPGDYYKDVTDGDFGTDKAFFGRAEMTISF
jgi:hypothetical protein